MFGAKLTLVQKLFGHSDPKITERRYGHLLPDFMKWSGHSTHCAAGRRRTWDESGHHLFWRDEGDDTVSAR
jgi:hypothetical protein